MPPKRRAATTRARPAPTAPPVDPGEAAVATAMREAEEAAAALEAARRASEAASRHLATLRAYAAAGLVGERGQLLEPVAEKLSDDVWRSEVFPRLSALDTIHAAAVCRSWAADVASGAKGRGEIVVRSGNLAAPAQDARPHAGGLDFLEKLLKGQQNYFSPPPPRPPQQQLLLPESSELQRSIQRAQQVQLAVWSEKNLGAKPGLAERCRENAGSLRRAHFRFQETPQGVSRSELEAVASLVSDAPMLSSIILSTPATKFVFEDWICRTPRLLPCLLRAVAEGVAASSPLDSARRGGGRGGHLRALTLRGYLLTEHAMFDYGGRAARTEPRDLPGGWAEGLGGISSSAAGAAAAGGASASASAAGATTTAAASNSTSTRPYEEMDDVALASSALALLAKNSPIEKLALDINFWQPRERDEPPSPRQSDAEAAARRAAPRTLGALLHPLANQLVDLSVDSEQWRLATRGGFARAGASAPPAPPSLPSSSSAAAAAANARPPPGLGPLPSLRCLRLLDSGSDPTTSDPVTFFLSRASFEGGLVRPSTLHFVKGRRSGSFVVAAEDDFEAVLTILREHSNRPAAIAALVGARPPAPLDAALAPLADCVTELLIDISEARDVGQTFLFGFPALRGLRRLALRLARPLTSVVLNDLSLSAFSRAHGGTLTSLDVSGFVSRKLTASPPFSALRRLVVRGVRTPRGSGSETPFRLPSQRGGFLELEFLAVGHVGHRPGRLRFSDREWLARFCAQQSRQTQGSLDLERLFSKNAFPKLKLLLLENCDLVLSPVKSLAAFRRAGAGSAAAASPSSSSSGGGASACELVSRFFAESKQFVRLHLHRCRFQRTDGSFVEATAETLSLLTGLTADAARAAVFLQALASSVSSSSSLPDGGGARGGGGGGGGKKRTSQKKGGGPPPPPPPPSFKGFCFGCDAWGEWDDFVDEVELFTKRY